MTVYGSNRADLESLKALCFIKHVGAFKQK